MLCYYVPPVLLSHSIVIDWETKNVPVVKEQYIIRASVDALCRDDASEISRDPRTKRLQTRRESLAMPSKHTNKNF